MRMGKINRDVLLAAVSQDRNAKKQMRAVAAKVRDDARRLAPVNTGNLRRSIKVFNHYDPETKTVVYRVGWDRSVAFYGWMVEAGTEDTRAQPHLRPAAVRNGGVPPQAGD
jgi:HK97 gp10 family phage protein